MSTIFGWDVIFGKELLFNFPFWWSFDEIERGRLLVHSVERLKQVDLLNRFNNLYTRLHRRGFKAVVYGETARYKIADDRSHKETFSMDFNDSLLLESPWLILYDASAATLCFFAEMLIYGPRNIGAHV